MGIEYIERIGFTRKEVTSGYGAATASSHGFKILSIFSSRGNNRAEAEEWELLVICGCEETVG